MKPQMSFVARSATGSGYAGLTRKYDLETTTDLANPNSWQAVAGHTNITGADHTASFQALRATSR